MAMASECRVRHIIDLERSTAMASERTDENRMLCVCVCFYEKVVTRKN